MQLGPVDEGAPGSRVPAIYVVYFRRLFQNKLAVYHVPSVDAFAKSANDMLRRTLQG